MNLLKKSKWLFVLLTVMLVMSGCTSKVKSGTLEYVSAKTVLEKIENKESFVVYVGTTDCTYCIKFKPVLEEVVKENEVTLYGLILDALTDEVTGMVASEDGDIERLLNDYMQLSGTPTTFYFVDGVIDQILVGYYEKEDVVTFLKDNKILK